MFLLVVFGEFLHFNRHMVSVFGSTLGGHALFLQVGHVHAQLVGVGPARGVNQGTAA